MCTWEERLLKVSERYKVLNVIHGKHGDEIRATVQCKNCDKVRTVILRELAKEKVCPNCKRLQQLEEKHKDFVAKINVINPNIEILGKYQGVGKKVDCRCKIDGYEWTPFANNLLKGHGCPKCQRIELSKTQTKSHNDFVKQLKEINSNLELLGQYSGGKIHTKTMCKVCGYTWNPRPDNLLSGFGCPECARKNSFYTHDQFVSKIKNKWTDIEITSLYKDSYTSVDVKCNICGHEWKADPSQILFYGNCPACAEKIKHTASFPNRILYSVLDFLKVKYIPEFKYSDSSNRFDVYIPDIDTIVEMNGMQHYKDIPYWHSYVKDVQANDAYKKSLAESHNISNYIVVDARFSRFAWILKNITNSALPGLLNTSSEKILEKRDEIENIFKTIK